MIVLLVASSLFGACDMFGGPEDPDPDLTVTNSSDRFVIVAFASENGEPSKDDGWPVAPGGTEEIYVSVGFFVDGCTDSDLFALSEEGETIHRFTERICEDDHLTI